MKYVDVRVRLPDELLHPMAEFIQNEDVVRYEEVVAWNFAPEESLEYELFYVEAEREPYEAKVQTVDSIREYRISPVDEGAFHVYAASKTREEDTRWRQAFAALDLVVVPPVAYLSDGAMQMTIVGDGDEIQTMLDSLPAGIEVEVDEIGTYERRRGLAGPLSDRQREAVQTAVDLGYYEVPRTASLADVAGELDCAESTASEVLRRAESAVLSTLVDRRWPH